MPPDLIPHRGAARLVDAIVETAAGTVVCRGHVPAGSPLAAGGLVPAFVALEVAAQAAAVQRALEADAHGEPRSGTLVAIRDAVFHTDALPVETPLVATARRIARAGPLAVHEVSIAGPDGRTCLRAILSTHAAEAALDPPP